MRFVGGGSFGLAAAVLLAACADFPKAVGPQVLLTRATSLPQDSQSVQPTHEPSIVPLVGVTLTAQGALRPGQPISFQVRARARMGIADAAVSVYVVGADTAAVRLYPSKELLGHSQGAMSAREERVQRFSFTFPTAGLYMILARAIASPAASTEKSVTPDTVDSTVGSTSLFVLVTPQGGAAQPRPPALPAGAFPRYGLFGPFANSPGTTASPQRRLPGAISPTTATSLSCPSTLGTFCVAFYFIAEADIGYPDEQLKYGGPATAVCYGVNNVYLGTRTVTPDGSGVYAAACPSNTSWVNFSISSLSDSYFTIYEYDGGGQLMCARNTPNVVNTCYQLSATGRAFNTLHDYIPLAVSNFGRGISNTRVVVDEFNQYPGPGSYSKYDPSIDQLQIQGSEVTMIHETSLWLVLHELGHAYDWKAIEHWPGYSVTRHDFYSQTSREEAWVEAFADFFSLWLARDVITSVALNSGDYGVENDSVNVYPYGWVRTNPVAGTDGMRVEASIAAFLWDIVDVGNERDGRNNEVGPIESFDNVSISGATLANVMNWCRLDAGHTIQLNGVDQLVYCLERSTSARSEATLYFSPTSWLSYSSVDFEHTVTTPDPGAVRTLWRYDLYGR